MQNINTQFAELQNSIFRLEKVGKYDFINIKKVYDMLNLGNTSAKIIHIAGTNGKGSTARMCYSILQQAGKDVGIFTSPHLNDLRERFEYNGKIITQDDFVKISNTILALEIPLSFFEMCVIIALVYFKEKNAEYMIIEVGMGGRLDATNILSPNITAITSISYDHQEFLGNTLQEISREKAGIIKENTPVILANNNAEIEKIAKKKHAKIIFSSPKNTNLLGTYQQQNAGIAFEIAKYFGISEVNICSGLMQTKHPGRLDFISKNMLIDGAHNEDGLKQLQAFLKQQNKNFDTIQLCISVKRGKRVDSIVHTFPKNQPYIIVESSNIMLEKSTSIANELQKLGCSFVIQKPEEIKRHAKDTPNTLFVIFGSLYMIGSFYT